MSAFFTWETLATIAGATAATAYIVQFLKKFSLFSKLNSQAVSYGVALIILFLATYFTGGLNASTGVMLFFNAVIVAFSSNGAYDSVKSTITVIESATGTSESTSAGNTATTPDNAPVIDTIDSELPEGASTGAAEAASVKQNSALSSGTQGSDNDAGSTTAAQADTTAQAPTQAESGAVAPGTTDAQ